MRGAILWGVLCKKAFGVYSGAGKSSSYLRADTLEQPACGVRTGCLPASSMAGSCPFGWERTRHPRTWPCIPKLYGQLFPDLVLAVSSIEAYLCMIEAGALDETKHMAADARKNYVCMFV